MQELSMILQRVLVGAAANAAMAPVKTVPILGVACDVLVETPPSATIELITY